MESDSEDSWLDGNEEPIQYKEPSEDEEPSKDEEPSEDEANFKQTLLERINEIQGAGSFAFSKSLASCPYPGISVDGKKPFPIPLTEEAAQEIASKSEKAPYGNHKETLVDDAVRKTLQISAERVSFKNSQWGIFVDELAKSVVHELGGDGTNVRAEFNKHLLYEPGAMFKPHKDTEKDPGMFGTLVICLPSKHTGGTVCLQHGEKSLKLSTAETSAYGYSCLAWYADVTHEIEIVKTGYRWVLTYNLITDNERSRASAMMLDSQILGLVNALSSWETQQYPPDFLVYALDHQYTPRNLRLSCLKDRDYRRASCLAKVCDQHGKFYLFLAQLDMCERWANDENEEHDVTQERYLHHVCSLQGVELSPLKVGIDRTSLLNSTSYDKRNPYSRVGGEYLGNQYCDFMETYSDLVLVMVRAASLHAPLFKPRFPQDVDKVMGQLRAAINDNTKTMLQEILVCLCREIVDEKFAAKTANDEYLGHAVVTAVLFSNWPLFEEARKKTLKISRWNHKTWSTLGGLIDLQMLRTKVDDLFEPLIKYDTFYDAYECLTNFYNGFLEYNIGRTDTTKAEYWKQWYSDKLLETLYLCDSYHNIVSRDAVTVKKIISGLKVQYTPEQREKIDEAVTKLVDRLTAASEEVEKAEEFVNELNVELLSGLSDPNNARKEFLYSLFGDILEFAISAFELPRYCRDSRVIREFYKRTLAHNKDLAKKLLRQILHQVPEIDEYAMLRVLSSLVEELSLVDTPSQKIQAWLETFVKAYIIKAAGEEPLEPEDWARPAERYTGCYPGCKVCPELNLFIKNPNAEEKTMALTFNDQNHATRNFPYLKIGNGGHLSEVLFIKTSEHWKERHRRWESRVEAAQKKLQRLPKLKQVLGDDKYNWLIGSTAQAADKAQPPLKRKGEDTIDAGAGMTSKRFRVAGENNED